MPGCWQIFENTGDFFAGDTYTILIQTNFNILLIDNVYISIQEVDKVNFIILNKIYNTRGAHQSTTAAADLTDLYIYWAQINLWYCEWLCILYFIFGENKLTLDYIYRQFKPWEWAYSLKFIYFKFKGHRVHSYSFKLYVRQGGLLLHNNNKIWPRDLDRGVANLEYSLHFLNIIINLKE